MSSSLAEEEETWGNIFNSAIPQVDVRRPQQVFGTAQYVAAEVLVSYFARYLFKVENNLVLNKSSLYMPTRSSGFLCCNSPDALS